MAEVADHALPPKPEFLPVDLDYITDDLRKQAEYELSENQEKMVSSLKQLRALLQKEKDLSWQDDTLFLLAFLRARKYDVKRALALIKGLYSCFGKHGRVFYTMDMDRLNRLMDVKSMHVLPYRDSQGSVVLCIRYLNWDPEVFPFEDMLSCVVLCVLLALTSPSTQIAGFRFIVDFKDLSLKHILYTRPTDLLFIADIFQSTAPIRVKGIHVVNQTSLFYYLWHVIKHFLSKKIRDRIHIHGSDMKTLHEFIHPSILPADLGGELPKFDNAGWREKMEASADYLSHVLSFGYEKYLKKDWSSKNQ